MKQICVSSSILQYFKKSLKNSHSLAKSARPCDLGSSIAKESHQKKSFRIYSVFSQCCICRDVWNWKYWLKTIYKCFWHSWYTFAAKITNYSIFLSKKFYSPIHRVLCSSIYRVLWSAILWSENSHFCQKCPSLRTKNGTFGGKIKILFCIFPL